MKTLIKRLAEEWEKTLLWVSVILLTAVILVQLSGLLREHEGEAVRSVPAPPRHAFLNETTAFAFLQPLTLPPKDSRNPFEFSCKFPAQAAQPTERRPWRRDKPPQAPPPAGPKAAPVQAAATPAPPTPPPAPPPPKRALVLLYRGLYRSGDAAGRQLAFVSAKETPKNASSTQVLAEGQAVAGVTVTRFGPDELVVNGPVGGEVTIPIGQQKKIPLE